MTVSVSTALADYFYKSVNTTTNGDFANIWLRAGTYEIFIFDTLDVNKWIKLIYTTNAVNNSTLVTVSNATLTASYSNIYGTIRIAGGSGNYKAISTYNS